MDSLQFFSLWALKKGKFMGFKSLNKLSDLDEKLYEVQ